MNNYKVKYWLGDFETLKECIVTADSENDRVTMLKQIKAIDNDVTYIQSVELLEDLNHE